MNPRTSAQDVMRCDLCETVMVEMHCDVCHVNLCKACVGEHFSADLSISHKIVAFKDRYSTLLYPDCPSHEKEQCEMYCNQCDTPICTACIASGKHSGHNISQIRQIHDDRRNDLEKENKKIKQSIFPTYQGILSEIKNKMSQLEKKYGDLSTGITKHGETWHRKIDLLVNKLKSEADKMKEIHFNALKKHLQHIEGKINLLDQILNSHEMILDSNDTSILLGYKSQVPELSKLPAKIDALMPHFTPVLPWNCQEEQLLKFFGKLSTLSITSEEHGYKMKVPQQSPETKSSQLFKQLLDEPETVNSINTGYGHLYNVACVSNEKIWTSGYDSTMNLYSLNQGSLLQSITTKSGKEPHDIAVTKSGDLIYSDDSDRTVNVVKNEKIEEVIRLQTWKPLSVYGTSSGDLLVTMDSDDNNQSKVVCYSGSTEKQAIQFDDEGNPLYSQNDKYISENKNLDICVAVNGDGAVVVVDYSGKLRFRYTGHTPAPKNRLFSPRGITTDSQSHILTADDNNQCIHIIDQDGQFLLFVRGVSDPWGICTDIKDNLFVAQRRNKEVKIIKISAVKYKPSIA